MRKALILDEHDIDTFSEVRHALVAMGVVRGLYKAGKIHAADAMDRILDQLMKADDAFSKFWKSGL